MLKNQKYLFKLSDAIHYLNCAYKAPLLKSSEEGVIKALQREYNPIDFSSNSFFEDVDSVRSLFGKLVNSKSSQVVIIPSTSYGFASVFKNIPYKKGQHALTVQQEFPSDYYSLKRWCDTHNAELKIVTSNNETNLGNDLNKKLIDNINESTAIINISSVHWTNGMQFDLEAIGKKCKTVGAKFVVDGTQSVGALPMNVEKFNIDALVCASYKWLIGTYSMGLMYISSEFNNGIPIEESWMNRANAKNFKNLTDYSDDYASGAARYNVGQTSNFLLIPILKSGLQQVLEWTPEGVQAYCKRLTQPLKDYLKSINIIIEDSYGSSHIIGINLPKTIDINKLTENLLKHKVYLSVRSTSLRVSVNVFNTKEDIDKLIEVIEETRKS